MTRLQLCVNPTVDMLGRTSAEFVTAASEAQSVSRRDCLDAYRNAFRSGAAGDARFQFNVVPIDRVQHEHGTIKFIQRFADGLEAESVILPYRSTTGRTRNTLCVSSQIGCAMGCTFCETAQMGFMRNLSAAEIVGQWWAATHEANTPINNIVFMGMGEPMDNLDNVIQAIRVLTDRNGAAIAPGHISVSTVGRADGIRRLAEFAKQPGYRKLRLAVSINAPNDEIRSRIMPINRATPMAELMEAMKHWPADPERGRQRVLIEYVLIPGVNDAPEYADELCAYLRPLKSTVNVIPYNPRRNSPWPAPTDEAVLQFVQRVHDNGQFVKRRQTLGRSVMAACGQLGNPTIRGRKMVR